MKKALVIGAGPAGISASLYLARNNSVEVTVITNGQSALAKAELIENYFGFAEPVPGKVLLENGRKNAERLGVRFIDGELLELQLTMDMKYSACFSGGAEEIFDSVLIATGTARKAPKIKGLSEFEGKGIGYCAICDAFFYRNKPTAVIGSGEYAVHEAVTLSNSSSAVTILTDGNELSSPLPDGIYCNTKKIAGLKGGDRLEKVIFDDGSELEVPGVFIAVGTAGSTDLARKIGAFTEGNRITVNEDMATSVPGLFAAGDCTGGLLQVAKAVSDGAIAGLSMIKFMKTADK